MELIDTHAHLTFDELEGDIDGVLARSRAAGVTAWVTVGTDIGQAKRVLALVDGHENMYAAIGVHPHYAKDISDDELAAIKEYAAGEKVVAIGETGLDYHYEFSDRERQKEVFCAQLEIAAELDLPVIIHCREAFDDVIAILDQFKGSLKGAVIHCYSGNAAEARQYLDMGFHISFTGIVTFKNSIDVQEAAKIVPLDRMMVETDCPYISPVPVRNKRPCEPAFLVHTARKLAELKGIDPEEFARAVTATSRRFFDLS